MSSTLRSIGIETAKTLYDTIRGRDSNFLFFLGGAETVTENKNTIDDDVTIPSGTNGVSAGAITISSGNTVTVKGEWRIV